MLFWVCWKCGALWYAVPGSVGHTLMRPLGEMAADPEYAHWVRRTEQFPRGFNINTVPQKCRPPGNAPDELAGVQRDAAETAMALGGEQAVSDLVLELVRQRAR